MVKKVKKVLKNNRGFSLIELIVVIAILGVLAGVAAPNIVDYVNDAREKADIANGAIIANAYLRAIAEGYTLAATTDTKISEVDNDGNLTAGGNGGSKTLVPDFIQTLPIPKQSGFKKFYYSYKDNTLIIYKGPDNATATGTGVVQVYPYTQLD
ncbi:type II secretion system protein [Petroclostridium xylanilyticum]|jgi:type IV pilus assembly protein PilA|uniref:type II secretion system protein n=1 Tax=Petroclostridium xylanilyticum TaxID=1792311 RepID=UPI000B98C522|nr:type II secretion system protein [Petroclostridium xylanilyticum]